MISAGLSLRWRGPAGANVGIAHGFDFFDAFAADKFIKSGKTMVQFGDQFFRAEVWPFG